MTLNPSFPTRRGNRVSFALVCMITMILAHIAQAQPQVLATATNESNGKTYLLLEPSTWTQARDRARQLGGELATVRNAMENEFIYTNFSQYGGQNRNLWIGMYDLDETSNSTNRAIRRTEFGWLSGEPTTYSNWAPVEPNNPNSCEPVNCWEFYVHIWQPGDINRGRWNNLRDSTTVFGVPVCGVVEIDSCQWGTARLLFRESNNASWGFGNDGIPGWDHAALFVNSRVWESHPGYCPASEVPDCPVLTCPGSYYDPECDRDITVMADSGVQSQFTLGAFRQDSPCPSTQTANAEVLLDDSLAIAMEAFIETQQNAPFLFICPSPATLTCLRDRLAPGLQKGGGPAGAFTCCGLMERAAEEAGHRGGQGFIDNDRESVNIPRVGEVPLLSPVLLYWHASYQSTVANAARWLSGLFDPVDFVIMDPLGRRLGHTAALGTLNEIPGALYSGSGDIEQFFIPDPIPGQYTIQLVGIGQPVECVIGGSAAPAHFEGFLPVGVTELLSVVVGETCAADFDGNSVLAVPDIFAFLSAWFANSPAADFDGSGLPVAVPDIFAFLSAWFAGCP